MRPLGYVHNPNGWIDPLGLTAADPATATHITYMGYKTAADGIVKPYIGYASLPGDQLATDVLKYRYSSNFGEFAAGQEPQILYRGYGTEAGNTARGLEQYNFEAHGGKAGTSNVDNPVGPRNPKRNDYIKAVAKYLKGK